jgi:hypothetical protein
MTERKPPGVRFESWVERQIREAEDRGEFDNLPGLGKPLPGAGQPPEELWWVKSKLRQEELSTEALLPASLQLRREIERLPETVDDLPTERAVREMVEELNLRIAKFLRAPTGPPVPVRPVDPDDVVRRWEEKRQAVLGRNAAIAAAEQASAPRARWWWRLTGRRR